METGTVKWFDYSKHFGFIVREGAEKGGEVFFHSTSVHTTDPHGPTQEIPPGGDESPGEPRRMLVSGVRVEFTLKASTGRRVEADIVRITDWNRPSRHDGVTQVRMCDPRERPRKETLGNVRACLCVCVLVGRCWAPGAARG